MIPIADSKTEQPSVSLAKHLRESQSLEEFAQHLEKVTKYDVITSSEVQSALLANPKRVFCLLDRAFIEGREPLSISWIPHFQEFLLVGVSQNEIRTSKVIHDIFTEFIKILNSKKSSDFEIRECLRTIRTTPILADYAWNELYKSSLTGLIEKLDESEDLKGLLTSACGISSILKNRKVLEVCNSRGEEISTLITGRKSPLLAVALLSSISTLKGNPWNQETSKKKNEYDLLDEDLRNTILGRFSRSVPKKEKVIKKKGGNDSINLQYIEERISKLGWQFCRNYLIYLAKTQDIIPEVLLPIAYSQDPMGRIKEDYVLYCLRYDVPLPYQILQSALGTASDYVLDIRVIEAEYELKEFPSDCPDLTQTIPARTIRENHLVNGRTGLRLDETYLGTRGIIRTLLDREEEFTTEIVTRFLESLIISPRMPIAIKRRAKDTLRLIEKE